MIKRDLYQNLKEHILKRDNIHSFMPFYSLYDIEFLKI